MQTIESYQRFFGLFRYDVLSGLDRLARYVILDDKVELGNLRCKFYRYRPNANEFDL